MATILSPEGSTDGGGISGNRPLCGHIAADLCRHLVEPMVPRLNSCIEMTPGVISILELSPAQVWGGHTGQILRICATFGGTAGTAAHILGRPARFLA